MADFNDETGSRILVLSKQANSVLMSPTKEAPQQNTNKISNFNASFNNCKNFFQTHAESDSE